MSPVSQRAAAARENSSLQVPPNVPQGMHQPLNVGPPVVGGGCAGSGQTAPGQNLQQMMIEPRTQGACQRPDWQAAAMPPLASQQSSAQAPSHRGASYVPPEQVLRQPLPPQHSQRGASYVPPEALQQPPLQPQQSQRGASYVPPVDTQQHLAPQYPHMTVGPTDRLPQGPGACMSCCIPVASPPPARDRRESERRRAVEVCVELEPVCAEPTVGLAREVTRGCSEASLPSSSMAFRGPEPPQQADAKANALAEMGHLTMEEIESKFDSKIKEMIEARLSSQDDSSVLKQQNQDLRTEVDRIKQQLAEEVEQHKQTKDKQVHEHREHHASSTTDVDHTEKIKDLKSKLSEKHKEYSKLHAQYKSMQKKIDEDEQEKSKLSSQMRTLRNDQERWKRDKECLVQEKEKVPQLQKTILELERRLEDQGRKGDLREQELHRKERQLARDEKDMQGRKHDTDQALSEARQVRREAQEQKHILDAEMAEFRKRQEEWGTWVQEQEEEWRHKEEQHEKYGCIAKTAKEQTDKMWNELTQQAQQCKQMQREAEEKTQRAEEKMQRAEEKMQRAMDAFQRCDVLERENQALREEAQDGKIQQEECAGPIMTPGDIIRMVKHCDDLHAVKGNADLSQEVSSLKENMKWLAWHNDILCRNMPKERSWAVEKEVGDTSNPMQESWQIPKYLTDFLASAKHRASRGASLGGC